MQISLETPKKFPQTSHLKSKNDAQFLKFIGNKKQEQKRRFEIAFLALFRTLTDVEPFW